MFPELLSIRNQHALAILAFQESAELPEWGLMYEDSHDGVGDAAKAAAEGRTGGGKLR